MKDALRSKIDAALIAAVAFAAGLGIAAQLDLTPPTFAAGYQSVPGVQTGAPEELQEELRGVSFQDGFSSVAKHIAESVVTIQVERRVERGRFQRPRILPRPFDEFFDGPEGDEEPRIMQGSGSGFVISPEGYIVTNNHVVENAENITVTLADRREIRRVELVGRDPTTDVALLKVDADDLVSAPLGRSDSTRVGEWVLAIGSPGFGAGANDVLYSTVTAGIVSAKGRNINILNRQLARQGLPSTLAIEDFIQTDAVINQGNSGGPLVNARGEVIGVNTAIMSETGTYQGYGFAVPIELVREVIDDLIEYGEVRRAVLGVLVEAVSAADARYYQLDQIAGAKISDLSGEDSPAAEAGLEPGDVIIAVDGDRIESVSDLQRRVRAREAGEEVNVTVVRRSTRDRETVGVSLQAADAPEASRRRVAAGDEVDDPLGIEVTELDARLRARLDLPDEVSGVAITDAERRGPLMRAAGGISRFTIIQDIDGRAVTDLDDYRSIAAGLEPGSVVSLRLYDPQLDQHRFVTVEIPSG